ncbi:MAG: hypothetical protein O7A04_05750 [Acidobacteria bacterium]|nr:hypothetical protein [Acidobacteriota bacterium]
MIRVLSIPPSRANPPHRASIPRRDKLASHGIAQPAGRPRPVALGAYAAAADLLPHNLEVSYWQAVTMVGAGRTDEALPIFREVFARGPHWLELTRRLPAVGLLPAEEAILDRILATGGE